MNTKIHRMYHLASHDQTNNKDQLSLAEDIFFASELYSCSNNNERDNNVNLLYTATISSKRVAGLPRCYVIQFPRCSVRRTFADFCRLFQALQLRFPAMPLPPLPSLLLAQRTVIGVKHNTNLLLGFLQALAKNPHVATEPVFVDFCSEDVLKLLRKDCLRTRQMLWESCELSTAAMQWSNVLANTKIRPNASGRCAEEIAKAMTVATTNLYDKLMIKTRLRHLRYTARLLHIVELARGRWESAKENAKQKKRALQYVSKLEEQLDRVHVLCNRHVRANGLE